MEVLMEPDQFKRIEELLESILKNQLNGFMEKEFNNPTMKQLYELTGKANIREIETKLKLNKSKISTIWQKWENIGLIKKEGKFYDKVIK